MFFQSISWDSLLNKLSLHNHEVLSCLYQSPEWLLGFSGGADSVLSLCFLIHLHLHYQCDVENIHVSSDSCRKKRVLTIVYIHHQMSHSMLADRARVFDYFKKQLSKVHGLTIHWVIIEKDVPGIAKKMGWSFEYTGAVIRRKLLAILRKQTAGVIILGHTLSDWYETLIMRINRGSSLPHLMPHACISDHFTYYLIRPLSNMFRQEVRDLLQNNHIPYWDDPTNTDCRILRNKIRIEYPILNYQGLRKTANNMLLLQHKKANIWCKHHMIFIVEEQEVRIPYETFKQLQPIEQTEVKMSCLRYIGFPGFSQTIRILLSKKYFIHPPFCMELEYWNGLYLTFRRGRFTLGKIQKKTKTACLHYKTQYQSAHYSLQPSVFLASHITKNYKISLNFGHKSVKKLLNEKKISTRQKHNLYLLLDAILSQNILYIPLSIYGQKDIILQPKIHC